TRSSGGRRWGASPSGCSCSRAGNACPTRRRGSRPCAPWSSLRDATARWLTTEPVLLAAHETAQVRYMTGEDHERQAGRDDDVAPRVAGHRDEHRERDRPDDRRDGSLPEAARDREPEQRKAERDPREDDGEHTRRCRHPSTAAAAPGRPRNGTGIGNAWPTTAGKPGR